MQVGAYLGQDDLCRRGAEPVNVAAACSGPRTQPVAVGPHCVSAAMTLTACVTPGRANVGVQHHGSAARYLGHDRAFCGRAQRHVARRRGDALADQASLDERAGRRRSSAPMLSDPPRGTAQVERRGAVPSAVGWRPSGERWRNAHARAATARNPVSRSEVRALRCSLRADRIHYAGSSRAAPSQ